MCGSKEPVRKECLVIREIFQILNCECETVNVNP